MYTCYGVIKWMETFSVNGQSNYFVATLGYGFGDTDSVSNQPMAFNDTDGVNNPPVAYCKTRNARIPYGIPDFIKTLS